jgi:hypothetical protein
VPTTSSVSALVRQELRDRLGDDAAEALELLRRTRLSLPEGPAARRERDRIQLAMIKLAGTDIGKLREAATLAALDWRDLLVAAGLANADWPRVLAEAGMRVPE